MKYTVTLNGNKYEVEVEGVQAAAPAPAAAPAAPAAEAPVAAPVATPANVSGTEVAAPLPGKILKVNAAVGQAVKAGDDLVILEAMKMENEIKAPADGVVKAVNVSVGTSVSTGDVLVVIG